GKMESNPPAFDQPPSTTPVFMPYNNNPIQYSNPYTPQPVPDTKNSSLFQTQSQFGQPQPQTIYKPFPEDVKRTDFMDHSTGSLDYSGSGGNQIEAVLVSQWGNYVQWSNEQVLSWARELRFGEEFVECLKAHNVDGTILNTIDRETIRTDFGITDIRLRAAVLASLDRLRGLNSGNAVAAVAGSSYVGESQQVVGSTPLPPAYNNGF
ncbi:hypothetical protein HDU76_004045, partial [Blyttiomyces sp. JEL0837]